LGAHSATPIGALTKTLRRSAGGIASDAFATVHLLVGSP
jgi:hypothetical protein